MVRRGHVTGGFVGALVAVLATAAAPAGAANFPGGTATWKALSIGIPANGSIIAPHTDLHSFSAPVSSTLAMSRRPLGGAYANELTFNSTATDIPATPPQLATAASGASVAVWMAVDNPDPEAPTTNTLIQASYRTAAGVWSAPTTLTTITRASQGVSPDTLGLGQPALAISPGGLATVLVQRPQEPRPVLPKRRANQIVAFTHGATGGWSAGTRISKIDESSESPAVAVSDAGVVTAAWRARNSGDQSDSKADDHYEIDTSRFTGTWTAPAVAFASNLSQWWEAPMLAVSPDGHGVIAVQRSTAPKQVSTALSSGAGAWSLPQTVVSGGASSAPLAVGVSSENRSYVLYLSKGPTAATDNVGLIRAGTNGLWSVPYAVGTLGHATGGGGLAFAGTTAVAAWGETAPGPTSEGLHATRWTSAGALPISQYVDADGDDVYQVVSDHNGGVGVLYSATVDGSERLQELVDTSPPVLTGASVPSTAVVGVPWTASASFADLWTFPGSPSWNFGDGTAPVAQSPVTHTFTKAGTFTVSLTGGDSLNNKATRTYKVTVKKDAVKPKATLSLPICKAGLSKTACRKARAKRSAWRTLRGTATDPAPSGGLTTVKVGAYRKVGKRYQALVGKRFKTVSRAKAKQATRTVTLASGTWSLKLPATPARGTWTFTVRAVDTAGNVGAVARRTAKLR